MTFWLLSLTTTNWFYAWMIMEMTNWLLILWLFSTQSMLTLIIWQSICSMSFIYSIIIMWFPMLTAISMFMKSGMPPFHTWVTSLKWSWKSWMIFLTFHKTLPFLMIMTLPMLTTFIMLWPLMGLIMFYSNYSFTTLMWVSSLSDSAWMCMSNNFNTFWLYFLSYSFMWVMWGISLNEQFSTRISYSFIFFMMLGLPPLIMFFLKTTIWMTLSLMLSMILTISSWLIVLIYLSWIYMSVFTQVQLGKNTVSWIWLSLIVLLSLFCI